MNNEIIINNLTKKYGDFTAVNNLNLTIKSGELFALLGLNGAGKTTTVKMLTGLLRATSGSFDFGEYSSIKDIEKIRSVVGVSLQESALAPLLTTYENLELITSIYGYDKTTAKNKIDETLNTFGLTEHKNKKAKDLSGGLKRRLSIATSIIHNPKFLFLDEPTLGVDVLARRELWNLISTLKGKTTVILTTHYLEEAESLADRIGIMKDGELVALGTAKEITENANTDSFENAFIKTVGGKL